MPLLFIIRGLSDATKSVHGFSTDSDFLAIPHPERQHMSEMVERVARAKLPYRVIGRNSGANNTPEYFVDWDGLPAGKFVAGPFPTEEEAEWALDLLNARAVIEAMREPTANQERMMEAALSLSTPPTRRWRWIWQAMIDAELSALAEPPQSS
jgi:hypothetical protein